MSSSIYSMPVSILVPTAISISANSFFSFGTGKACAIRAPSGAVNTLATAMPISAGR